MARLVDCLGFDRTTFLEVTQNDGRVRAVASWARSDIPVFQSEDFARDYPWFSGRLQSGEVLALTRLPDDLPAEAAAERQHCEEVGLKSILTIPIAVGGAFRGIMSFGAMRTYRTLPDELTRRIRLIGEVFANAIVRARSEQTLVQALAEIRELKDRLQAENVLLREDANASHDFEEIVGDSVALRRVLVQAEQVAPTDAAVLITGETGTGKELIARAVHNRSPRREQSFVAVNCSALPAGLIESELFGHERGAFTGAVTRKIGRFEVANGGTIFLDEIGELAPDLQPKLLRVLQSGEFERVGATRTLKVDVRVIAATNCDLAAAVAQGQFRADLYYRLGVFPIHMPALRERREDVPLLAWFFITRKQNKLGKRIDKIPEQAMTALVSYPWPGNVRELENVIERALILSAGSTLHVDELWARGTSRTAGTSDTIESLERSHILAVLRACEWRVNGVGNAAARLGLNPSTLRFRMKKLAIARPGT
ncbi:MAG: sigma 54-interacting transcriptional regulator [Deltaproteobacteria bacterium]|nr:sigma 54-interacting transcriptional regulator [Deltaproteobacteria bacterium]MBI3386386.1 sigma 54-interacting transcriptional regulator [Deltaproteobacteria bacterium]